MLVSNFEVFLNFEAPREEKRDIDDLLFPCSQLLHSGSLVTQPPERHNFFIVGGSV